ADSLAADVPGATAGGLDTLDRVAEADLLVNATSVGMEPDVDETPVPAEHLHGDLAVLDAVYTPMETRLLRDAASAGATTVDGAWMLLFQGVEAFELWTGRDAPVEAMNEALRAELD
ncbi:shikimate dehydrogenase family protein, partial [Halobellus rarus]